jgi:hypothetical protein
VDEAKKVDLGTDVATFQSLLGDSWVENFLVQTLLGYKDRILEWVDSGEGAVFDALVQTVGERSKLLAAALVRYKSVIVSADDQVISDAFDKVIEALQGK